MFHIEKRRIYIKRQKYVNQLIDYSTIILSCKKDYDLLYFAFRNEFG